MAKLYRKSLLEKLQSPDQLDKMVKITPPSFWVAIAGGIFVITVALIWSLVGTIPEKLDTNGVYLYDQNTYTISSEVNGIVEDVKVEVGEEVVEGEELYNFDSDSLEEELKAVQERLEKVQKITLTSKNDEATQDTQNLLSYKAQYISGSNNAQTAGYEVALEKYEEAEEAETAAKKKAEEAYKAYSAAASKVDSTKTITYKQQLEEAEKLVQDIETELIYYQQCINMWNLYNQSGVDWNFDAARNSAKAAYKEATDTGRTPTNCHTVISSVTGSSTYYDETDLTNTSYCCLDVFNIKITTTGGNATDGYLLTIKVNDQTIVDNGDGSDFLDSNGKIKISDIISSYYKSYGLVITKYTIDAYTNVSNSSVSDINQSLYVLDTSVASNTKWKTNTSFYNSYDLPASSSSFNLVLYSTKASYCYYALSETLSAAENTYKNIQAAMATDESYSENLNLTSLKNTYDSAVNDYQTKAQLTASAKSSLASYEASDASAESSALASAKAYSTQFIAAKGSLVDQLEKEIEKYQKQIDANTVTATMDGIVTNLAVSKGTAVSQGTSTVVIRQKKDDQQVVLYVSLTDGKKIEEGMKVNVYPSTVNKSEYGHMVGTVTSVADYITTDQEIFNKVGDKSLASMFTQNGSVLEVVCQLEEDDTSSNGYKWSTEKGKTVSLKESTIVTAEVITSEQHPISILIPFLKDKLENLTKEESK